MLKTINFIKFLVSLLNLVRSYRDYRVKIFSKASYEPILCNCTDPLLLSLPVGASRRWWVTVLHTLTFIIINKTSFHKDHGRRWMSFFQLCDQSTLVQSRFLPQTAQHTWTRSVIYNPFQLDKLGQGVILYF